MGDFFLQSTDPAAAARKTRRFSAVACACLAADVACSAALVQSLHGGSLRSFTPGQLLDFHGDVFDLALASALRLLSLPLVAAVAAHLGRVRPDSAPPPPPPPRNGASRDAANGDSLTEPLLPVSVEPPAADLPSPTPSTPALLTVESLMASHRVDQARLARRNWLLALLFTLCTASAVFVGVKVVSFEAFGEGRTRAERGALLSVLAALCIAENSALARAVDAATRRPGALRRELHPHALFFANDKTIVAHLCDCCRKRVTAGYRCPVCDFDCCVECFVRRDLRGAEGGLRTDRGVTAASETPPSAYFMRALALARSEGPLLAAAMTCLAATTAATLSLPHYQGRILDTVWRGDAPAFRRDVAMLVAYSVASGAFGGLRALCFNLVGRRLAFDVRNSLLRALLTQDIAFFDAAATGDLTSRLSYDVNNMLSPIQTLLSSVVENGALLVGAIIACFLQSWQLSLLAVTTLTPATYVTQLYAAWSSTLNRHIAAALGEGNAAATEALANIRTVRVMSTEDEECGKYEERTRRALACGIRDACGGALALALTNYLNLFTSVLILGFGGSMALENHAAGRLDGLTAGRLVTFQLYWGMCACPHHGYRSLIACVLTQAPLFITLPQSAAPFARCSRCWRPSRAAPAQRSACWACWTPSPPSQSRAATNRRCRPQARSRFATWALCTRCDLRRRCCAACRWRCALAACARWWASPVAASPRCATCCCGCTTRRLAPSRWTAETCASWTCAGCTATRAAWLRIHNCLPIPSWTTSRTAAPSRRRRSSCARQPALRTRTTSSRRFQTATTRAWASAACA
jgi:hypothetical protein